MAEERKDVLEEILGTGIDVMGGLILAETWLKDGWDGTLDHATYVMDDLRKTVTAARGAMERIFELAAAEVEKTA